MRRGWGLVAGAAVVVAGGWWALSPRLGRASREAVLGAVPPSLRLEDAPDPAGERRYARVAAIGRRADRKTDALGAAGLSEVERILAAGGLRAPARGAEGAMDDLTAIRAVGKGIAAATKAASERGDRAACLRWASLGLRYGRAMRESGGVVIDGLVAVAVDAIGVRAAYGAAVSGGLTKGGERELLALLPVGDGSSRAMAEAVRRDFRTYLLPVLIDPAGHRKALAETEAWSDPDEEATRTPEIVGSFDPVATTRLAGAIDDAAIQDLRGAYAKRTGKGARLTAEAAEGLPQPGMGASAGPRLGDAWPRLKYRVMMNLGRNTLGRKAATSGVFENLGEATARNDATRNLLRAVILLRLGETPRIVDPFDGGTLRIDPKRRIVWSVGTDGKDDGGQIGRGWENTAPDLGFSYGDGSWPLRTP